MSRHLIIGAGAAGVRAAGMLRKMEPLDEITVVSTDEQVHSRCMLHKVLSGERTGAQINFVRENFFEENGVRWVKGETVTRIDPSEKKIHLECGAWLPYDKLLIAIGSGYVVPPIPHFSTAPNVYGFRDLSDEKLIEEALQTGKRAFIVGSGLVGLDAACALLERGASVTVAEMAPRVMPLQTDETAAAVYQRAFEAAGCVFHLGIGAADATVDAQGRIVSVKLTSGEEIPCDFVIVAAGVRPRTAFLEGSGIQCQRGVVVDQYLETTVPNIFAAGDITALSGVWPDAMKQGETAAMNMCGARVEYEDVFPFKNTSNFYGITMLSLGRLDDTEGCRIIIEHTLNSYKKAIVRDNILTALLIQGNIAATGVYTHLIAHKIPLDPAMLDERKIFRLSFADFYGFEKETGAYAFSEKPVV